jgi:CubicO group peptidase (beta-lactamase class C family)
MSGNRAPEIGGFVKPSFEAVQNAFVENFTRRGELGGACCIYLQGEPVVDIWGGVRNRATGDPWTKDTMVIVFSTTKGLAAMAVALANSRGLLDYEERVSTYWPEFVQHGKDKVTVRQLLSHQAGLPALDTAVDKEVMVDFDRLAGILAAQTPAWEPGTRQGYHALTVGFYEGELIRRVDPQHRSIGRFFAEEIAAPLGLDFYIGVPEDIPNSQLATLEPASRVRMLLHPSRFGFAFLNPKSLTHRAFWKEGMEAPFDAERIYSRRVEVPSQGGVGTARAIAHAYSEFATGGTTLGLRRETLAKLTAPPTPPTRGFFDEVVKIEARLTLGYARPTPAFPFGSASAFGTPGAGGSFGFADPQTQVGYAYVTNKMGTEMRLVGDPREVALRDAFHTAIGQPTASAA